MAEIETRPRRQPSETETLTFFVETRPRRDVGTSRDRLETETSRPRPQPWVVVPVHVFWLPLTYVTQHTIYNEAIVQYIICAFVSVKQKWTKLTHKSPGRYTSSMSATNNLHWSGRWSDTDLIPDTRPRMSQQRLYHVCLFDMLRDISPASMYITNKTNN